MTNYEKGLPQRRSIRLKGYDYTLEGLYFITICCQDKICRFGQIQNGVMNLNDLGTIAHQQWIKLSDRFPNFELDVIQVMPNHIHAIINLATVVSNMKNANIPITINHPPDWNALDSGIAGAGLASTRKMIPCVSPAGASPAPTIANIVGAYKSKVANDCLEIFKSKNQKMGKLWQRNYYEHIIRNHESYNYISNYIISNPGNWLNDKLYQE